MLYTNVGCPVCSGSLNHEDWCPAKNPETKYAYEIVANPDKISYADRLVLHALGTAWDEHEAAVLVPDEDKQS